MPFKCEDSILLPLLAVPRADEVLLLLETRDGCKLDLELPEAPTWPLFNYADDLGRRAVLGLCYV